MSGRFPVLYRDRIVKLLSFSTKIYVHERVNSKLSRNSLKHSSVTGGAKWGHVPQGVGLGGESAHFLQSFKNAF